MTEIDKTARAILQHNDHRGALVNLSQLRDVQAMARLWLLVRQGKADGVLEQESSDHYNFIRDIFQFSDEELTK